jgi:hypothetical protein
MGKIKQLFMEQREKALEKIPYPIPEEKPTIIAARITAMPKEMFDPMPMVMVKYEDDPTTEHVLFEYYPDEISFSADEFIGLTDEQARRLKFTKDREYLRT